MSNRTKIHYLRILFIFLSVSFITHLGCAGQVEDKQEIPESKMPDKPLPPMNELPPGTAKLEAYMIDSNVEAEHFDCIIKVEKVLSYGRGAKPIGKGKEVLLQIPKDKTEVINLLSEGTLDQKFEFVVEQEQIVNMPATELRWRILEVRKIELDQ